jgi:hypothetical protein
MIGKILITYQLDINIRTNITGLDSDNDRLVKLFCSRASQTVENKEILIFIHSPQRERH